LSFYGNVINYLTKAFKTITIKNKENTTISSLNANDYNDELVISNSETIGAKINKNNQL